MRVTTQLSIWPNRIRELRKARGLTQSQLGERIDLSTQMVGHLELGKRTIALDHLRVIAAVLDCTPAELLCDSDNPYRLNVEERQLIDRYRLSKPADGAIIQLLAGHFAVVAS